MRNHLLKYVVPGQDPSAMYKWYEIYYPWPWPFHRTVITDCGWVLDCSSKEFKEQMKRWRKVGGQLAGNKKAPTEWVGAKRNNEGLNHEQHGY